MPNPMLLLFERFSRQSRQQKNQLFDLSFPDAHEKRILDIGGEVGEQVPMLMDLHPRKDHITVVNIDQQHLDRIAKFYPEIAVLNADARALPFADDEFDIVYSNAVIEHVGSHDDQQRMASEIARVGKRWFITTPNRWYPFEMHLRLPIIHWLPEPLMRRFARLFSFNHVSGRYQSGLEPDFRPLSIKQMTDLFPNSRIIAQRVTFWPETIIAIGPESSMPEA